MSGRNLNKTFRHPGFQLGKGNVFGVEVAAERIYEATVGPLDDDMSGHAAKREFMTCLKGLFTVLKGKNDLFRALRDTKIFWGTIAVNWETRLELPVDHIQLIVDTYVNGRRTAKGSTKQSKSDRNEQTNLGDLVDDWIETTDEVNAMGPQPEFNVAIRQHPVTVAAQDLENLDLSAGSTWPPKYLNAQECAWVADSHVNWQLRDNADSFPFQGRISKKDIPAIPNSLTYPQDVKLFLCWCNMARYNPAESKFAVFMAPIVFMDKEDRKDNYVATGSLSKRMATIGEFFDYALEMLNNQGRDMNDRCVRHGLGLALRRVPDRPSRVPGYQVLLYDPEHADLKKKKPRKPRTADKDHDELVVNMHEWREEVELVADQKLGKKKKFAELWCGGREPTLLREEYGVPLGDSVSHVAAWVFDAVNGRFPTARAPVVELEDKWGYEFIDTMHGPEAIKKKALEEESSEEEKEQDQDEEDESEDEADEADEGSDYVPSSSPSEYVPSP
ncbi:hypothetical protein PG989_007696 [Apiospora arundinis]